MKVKLDEKLLSKYTAIYIGQRVSSKPKIEMICVSSGACRNDDFANPVNVQWAKVVT